MNQIYDPPNDYNAGLDFDYAAWSADTQITLTNVPWNNDYRDVVYFDTTNDLNNYIDKSKEINLTVDRLTYAKVDEPIVISHPFNMVNKFNYVRVYNPAQPINGDSAKYFYYFITNVTYIAPNTTSITVQLDIWQTYVRQARFGRCYIERGHIGIANSRQFNAFGSSYLTVPEGLDTGDSYRPTVTVGETNVIQTAGANEGYSILIACTTDLEADNYGTKDNPNLDSARSSTFQTLPSGAAYYVFITVSDFRNFVSNFRDKPWITQGIISITAIPPIKRYYSTGQLGARLKFGGYKAPAGVANRQSTVKLANWRDNPNLLGVIGERYKHLRKLWTFPYMAIELTNLAGQSSIHRPELINSNDLTIQHEISLMPPGQRAQWWLLGYKAGYGSAFGIGYDHAVSVSNFPTLALLNDGAILALANNANSMAYGYQAADWSQQKALRGNEVSYDVANKGISTNSALTENDLAAQRRALGIGNQLTQNQMISNIGGSAIGGAAAGAVAGPAGALAGTALGAGMSAINSVGQIMQMNANQQQYNSSAMGARGATAIGNDMAGYVADTNRSLADWAARGDYESAIAGMNAKTRDMQLTPPSLAGQVGGEMLGILNGRFGYEARILILDPASMVSVAEYWLRYGYAVNRFSNVPQNFKVMSKFSYWKLKETFIRSAAMTETQKQSLRGILEKGVTVYVDPNDIGFVDPGDNKPLTGITLDGYNPPEIDPEPEPEPPVVTKKRKHEMIAISAIDTNPASPGNVYALAGASPGTDANWIEKRDGASLDSFLDTTGQEQPYGVTWAEFVELKGQFLAPVQTQEIPGDPA